VAILDLQRQQKAKEYGRSSRRLWLLRTILSAAFALAWLVFGWSSQLRRLLIQEWHATSDPWILVAVFALLFGSTFLILDLPLGYFEGFVLPHRFGQSTQSLGDWLTDQAKGLLIGAPIGLVLVELLYWTLRITGGWWWLWAAAGLLVVNVLLVNLAPVFIMPLFNKYVPLGESHQDLAQRLLRLAERAGTRVKGVYTFDMSRRTKSANAALTGLGNTRRIILGDTLINEFSPDEIETVLAHELGHQVHRDILLFISFGTVSTLVGLFLASGAMNWAVAIWGFHGISDVAGLPALGLIVGAYGLLTGPLDNALSRWRERLADQYALAATGKSRAFASALTRLANQNLGEVDPERWVVLMFHSHPALADRIGMAEGWKP
jgi:STE24 endopeptidase